MKLPSTSGAGAGLAERPREAASERPPGDAAGVAGVVIGELLAMAAADGTPLVFVRGTGSPSALPARTTVELQDTDLGCAVALLFERGDPARPVIVGIVRDRPRGPAAAAAAAKPRPVEIDVDGGRIVVHAAERLVLRCGKASITLTSAGKVLIEGAYVSSRSSGANRVSGGSVHLN